MTRIMIAKSSSSLYVSAATCHSIGNGFGHFMVCMCKIKELRIRMWSIMHSRVEALGSLQFYEMRTNVISCEVSCKCLLSACTRWFCFLHWGVPLHNQLYLRSDRSWLCPFELHMGLIIKHVAFCYDSVFSSTTFLLPVCETVCMKAHEVETYEILCIS